MNNHYPNIKLGDLLKVKGLINNLQDDPNYLDSEDCPYSGEVISVLKSLTSVQDVVEDTVDVAMSVDELLAETSALLRTTRGLTENLPKTADMSDKVAAIKAQTTLVEKLSGMYEKVHNLKDLAEFKLKVVNILEDELDVDQRSKFMGALNEHLSK